ncbi:MAG: CotH kinase family protein [Spirochaetia bacterium]|nr:CotH kinase family protein [Spirochaetia bacterium]
MYEEEKYELSFQIQANRNCQVNVQWFNGNSMESAISLEDSGSIYSLKKGSKIVITLPIPRSNYLENDYFCQIKTVSDGAEELAYTRTAHVTQKIDALPVLNINTVDNVEPTAEYTKEKTKAWTVENKIKVPGQVKILKAERVLYDSGEYAKKQSGMKIRIRGNSSAYGSKKPYKIKLEKDADLLECITGKSTGYKSKEWSLLWDANTLNTVTAFHIASKFDFDWIPKWTFVNVVMNNEYRGIYLLIEAVEAGTENKILVDKSGFCVENLWRSQFEDKKKFRSSNYYSFKYPEDKDLDDERISAVKREIDEMKNSIKQGTYDDILDVDSFTSFYLFHNIVGTKDRYGTNKYLVKYDNTENSKIKIATVWDFDSTFNYITQTGEIKTNFYENDFINSKNPAFQKIYNEKMSLMTESVQNDVQDFFHSFDKALIDEINQSRKYDSVRWSKNYNTVQEDMNYISYWLAVRTDWLRSEVFGKDKQWQSTSKISHMDPIKHYLLSILNSSRIDIKNYGGENNRIVIKSTEKVTEPSWFSDSKGHGKVVESSIAKQKMTIEIKNNGQLKLAFKGIDKRIDNVRFPLWADYSSIKINGHEILSAPVATWHDKPYKYEMAVKDGQIVEVEVTTQPHQYSRAELQDTILKLYPENEYIKQNIEKITDAVYKQYSTP